MQNLLCTVCACYLLGAQSMYSRSSKAAPPLTSFRRTTSNMTSKFLSFLRGISARFHLLPWCPVWFHTSFKLFSICGEEQRWTKRGSCGSISHTMVLQSHFKELQQSLLSEIFFSSFKPHVESEELLGQNMLNQICGQSAAAEKKGMASKRSH